MAESQEGAERYILDQFYGGNTAYTNSVEIDEEDKSNAYFNIVDIDNTLDEKTKALTRRHGGTQNDTTVGELIHDIKLFLEGGSK